MNINQGMSRQDAIERVRYATRKKLDEGSVEELANMLIAEVAVAKGSRLAFLSLLQEDIGTWLVSRFGEIPSQEDVLEEFKITKDPFADPRFKPMALEISLLRMKLKIFEQFTGIAEETGELAHSLLKQQQGIRGTAEEHEEKARDAVGDLAIFLLTFCCRKGWDFGEILLKTWEQVRKRTYGKAV